jgi:glycosyltransferase involved in cell wall biosynthesis
MRERPGRTNSTRIGAAFDWLRERAETAMETGSVLVHAPAQVFQTPGGGEVQLAQTARHLADRGVPVRPFCPWRDRLEDARLLHLFGMSRDGLELARIAKSRGVPIVLSPICWFQPRALWTLATSRAEGASNLAKWATRAFIPRLPSWRRELLALCDRILPNSRAEADQLVGLFGADRDRVRIVPNGVDLRFAAADPSQFRDAFGDESFVLYCGRVEPRKNVLGLIRAVSQLGRRLAIFGDPVPGHEEYARVCVRAGEGRALWHPRLDHDDPLLESAYAVARVFALPSWFETPGLAALEAGLAGTAVVITPFGCAREYFGELAHYARPDRPRELARAIDRAWELGADPALRERIAARYSWSTVARITAEAYDEISA